MPKPDPQTEARELLDQQEQRRVARLKYALAVRNLTQAALALQINVKPTTVGAVIHGRSRSKKVETRIAAATRMPLAELWPQWHGPNAKPSRRKSRQSIDRQRASAVGAA
ncbi:MAG: hypothetical protein WA961_14625 [Rhodanobacter sp.]